MEKRKIFCDKIHGVLDYGVVVIFATAPGQIGITGLSAALCYALAAAQLVMTLCSDMPLGLKKIIPMRIHGLVELTVSLALIAIGWILPSLFASGQLFFTLMGAIIFFVWVSSDYGDQQLPASA
ncbi:hypothetical protein [Dongia sp. agr-C8]